MRLYLVIGHDSWKFDALNEPFVECIRTDNPYVFDDGTVVNSLALSEYDSFFRFFDNYLGGLTTFGLLHYRCFLQIQPLFTNSRLQASNELDAAVKDNVIYVTSAHYDMDLFAQFLSCHKEFEADLLFACDKFFDLTGYDALSYLKQNSDFYYRNLFVSPIQFALEWYRLSKVIAYSLCKNKPDFINDRWIGFILERLFSAFVASKNSDSLQVVPIKFFGE